MSQAIPDFKEPVRLCSGIAKGDPGYFFVAAIIGSLFCQKKIRELNLSHEDALFEAYEAEVTNKEYAFIEIDDWKLESYDPEHLASFYQRISPVSIRDPQVLNLWIRAWSQGADTFMGIHEQCLSSEVLANLVECGGDILQALKL